MDIKILLKASKLSQTAVADITTIWDREPVYLTIKLSSMVFKKNNNLL